MPVGSRGIYEDDARLVTRALAGDQSAFRQLFEAYSPLVYRVTYRMLGNHDDAADLTQDVFVRAYQRLASLRGHVAFQAWITRLAVNLVHDHLRRQRPAPLSLDGPPPGHDEGMEWALAADDTASDRLLLARELSEELQSALLGISEDHRLVVVLHYLEGKAVEEIAALLQVPAGTVKSRLARARAELRKRLAAYVDAE